MAHAGDGSDRAGNAGPVGETVPAAADTLAVPVLAGPDAYRGADVHPAQMTATAMADAAEVAAFARVVRMPA
ncbi:MAG TPA: hypothetical protein VI365_04055 [Trebonia sp.]